ncbi:MAG: GNAT family N-acetyltransferase [Ruminococcaceae bacterium]|nr:GNAT family N-acetyltransferase [Oscillospiraceae bacterium]
MMATQTCVPAKSAAGTLEIREVTNKGMLRRFVDYPNVLYRDVPQFVPAFYGDDMEDWNRAKNPAFRYCEAKNFIALRDGEMVGRIGAILSHKANTTWGTKRMRFSQVDFIDDAEVSGALFAAVENWAREKGCDQVHGPLGFCDMDREGMLVEGFDQNSMFITYYNHPYYNDHLAALGYEKDTDWVENLIEMPAVDSPAGIRIQKLAQRVLKSGTYHKAPITKKSQITTKHIEQVFRLVNKAYAPLYGVVELNEEQIKKYAKKFLPLISPDLLCLLMDENEELVAFGVCAPSMAKALKRSRGRLFPFGWVGILNALKKNDTLDLLLIAVDPELQGKGLNAVVMDHLLQGAAKLGVKKVETGPTLETNIKVQSQWKFFEHTQHKRRRCYIKNI